VKKYLAATPTLLRHSDIVSGIKKKKKRKKEKKGCTSKRTHTKRKMKNEEVIYFE